jgi:hypothetical protein
MDFVNGGKALQFLSTSVAQVQRRAMASLTDWVE